MATELEKLLFNKLIWESLHHTAIHFILKGEIKKADEYVSLANRIKDLEIEMRYKQ